MREHILLEKAYRYQDPIKAMTPSDCMYQEKKGYWTKISTGEALMLSSDSRKPMSKKCDIETGEDQKGE